MRKLSALLLLVAVAAPGCALKQSIPVSTDPSGAAVYLDGKPVCAATPCSVEAETGKAHLLTIVKEGYRQRDIPLKPAQAGATAALTPDMVTLKLSRPGELDVRDPDSVVDTAVGVGVEMLRRVLEEQQTK